MEKQTFEGDGIEVTAISIGDIPEGRQRCKFLAVALNDKTIRILSLDPESCLYKCSVQSLPAIAESVCLLIMTSEDETGLGGEEANTELYLHAGL